MAGNYLMENLDRSRETPQDNDLRHNKNLKLDNSRNFRKFYLGTVGHEQIAIVSSTSTYKLHACKYTYTGNVHNIMYIYM